MIKYRNLLYIIIFFILLSSVCCAKPPLIITLSDNKASKQIQEALDMKISGEGGIWKDQVLWNINHHFDFQIKIDLRESYAPLIRLNNHKEQKLPGLQSEPIIWIDMLNYIDKKFHYHSQCMYIQGLNVSMYYFYRDQERESRAEYRKTHNLEAEVYYNDGYYEGFFYRSDMEGYQSPNMLMNFAFPLEPINSFNWNIDDI